MQVVMTSAQAHGRRLVCMHYDNLTSAAASCTTGAASCPCTEPDANPNAEPTTVSEAAAQPAAVPKAASGTSA
jgi:hypothetical protein